MDPIWQEILASVQLAGIFPDCKHFVDMPAARGWGEVVDEWRLLTAAGAPQRPALEAFVSRNFCAPGSDLEEVAPAAWDKDGVPTFLMQLPDEGLKQFGVHVYRLWSTLSRKVAPSVVMHPDRHTLLPLPYPFVIPGDRFRECYNWDSYWIIRGLLACGLVEAASQLLANLFSLVDRYGFVPNGARTYYCNRSQPPVLSAMVMAVWRACGGGGGGGDDGLAGAALPRLLRTHLYWTSGAKAVLVRLAGGGEAGKVYRLSRYCADLRGPRPESFREDVELAARAGLVGAAAEELYCDIASAAESGWDFSTRWFVGGTTLAHTRTTQVIPADLNSWLYMLERDIAVLAGHLGDSETQQRYAALAEERKAALNEAMWSERVGCWQDLLLVQEAQGPAPGGIVSAAPRADADASNPAPARADGPEPACTSGAAAPLLTCTVAAGVLPNGVPAAIAEAAVEPARMRAVEGHVEPHPDPTHSAATPRCAEAASVAASNGAHCSASGALPGASGIVRTSAPRDDGGTYASSWVPLWCGVADPGSERAASAVAGLQASGLLQPGGVSTSLHRSGQQWDQPNAWPPLVHMMVEGVAAAGVEGCTKLAGDIAGTWIRANLLGFQATAHMHEKYDAGTCGGVGGGGEYLPQVGFGWSNGVLLTLLAEYGVQCCG